MKKRTKYLIFSGIVSVIVIMVVWFLAVPFYNARHIKLPEYASWVRYYSPKYRGFEIKGTYIPAIAHEEYMSFKVPKDKVIIAAEFILESYKDETDQIIRKPLVNTKSFSSGPWWIKQSINNGMFLYLKNGGPGGPFVAVNLDNGKVYYFLTD